MIRTLFISGIIAFTFFGINAVSAQTLSSVGTKPPVTKKPPPLSSEFSGGFRLTTDGWGIFVDKGYIRSNEGKLHDQLYDVRLITLELAEHKDPKQQRINPSDQGGGSDSRPYIYGKINNFFTLKAGYGFRKMIAGKPEPGTVSIHWVNSGGFALGMLKPYYIDGYIPQDNSGNLVPATFKYTDSTKSEFLDQPFIRGAAGFANGLNEIVFVPGLHARTALHFDFASSKKTVMAIEAGANIEYYTKGIQIMANQDARNVFLNLFASFQFGGRK
jgi:hypothetical protein